MVKRLKHKAEMFFTRFGTSCFDHPFVCLSLIMSFVGFLTYQIPTVQVNTASEALLHEQDFKRQAYNQFRTEFGRPELIVIMVQADEIFDRSFLTQLKNFHTSLETSVPYLASVTSLINIPDIIYESAAFKIKGLLDEFSTADLKKIKSRANRSKLYENFILSEDAKTTTVIIETSALVGEDPHFFGAAENEEVVAAVKKVVRQFDSPGFVLTVSGEPVVEDAFNRATLKDLKVCVSLSLGVVCFFLILLFKRVSGVFLSMMITITTLVSTLGLMAWFGVQVKVTTIVMPAFIVAVSVAASVHILVIFYKHHEKTNNKQDAISFAMGHSGLAIFMTSLTTAAGLLSFSLAELVAIEEIGYLSAAGVMLSFFYTICLLPAVIALTKINKTRPKASVPFMDKALGATAKFSCRHPKSIVIGSIVLLVVSVFFMNNLSFSHDLLEFFPTDTKERQDMLKIDKIMKGSLSLELVIDTAPNTLLSLDKLNKIDRLCEQIKSIQMEGVTVGKTFSIADIVKQCNQAFNRNISLFYLIPQNPDIISKGVAHLNGQSDGILKKYIHKESGKTRITVLTTWADAMVFNEFIDQIEDRFKKVFNDNSTLHVTGLISLLARATHAATLSMAHSYLFAFIVISLMMILMLGDIKLGLVSMFPNLLPIIIVMGLMGALNTPFDLNSLMIGSIAIGLVVDDTVHFMYNFQRYYDQTGGDVNASVITTFLGTGKAMLITSLVLSSGFFILIAATLGHVVRFGVFTGLIVIMALLADFLLAPALMVLIHRRRKKRVNAC